MPSDLSFEEELVAFILKDSDIQSMVNGRIGPLPLEQGTKRTSITYFEVGRDDGQTQTGAACLAAHRWQLDCWAKTYAGARNLMEAVRKLLNGFDGPMGGFSRVSFFMENKLDTFEDDAKLYRGMLDFVVWYREEH